MSKRNNSKIEDQYKMKDPHQHVLDLPDTYIGGIEEDNHKMWVYNDDTKKMEFRDIKYIPGLYKIFDEVLVNSRDHTVRDRTCKTIQVDINDNTISVMNDGENGVPVVIHKEHNIYVPDMIFGRLLTSGNYDQKGKTVGGKNGLGGKLCLKKGTLIPTFDGEIKKIENIEVGENLIGDDGTSRKVLDKIEGNGELYEVTQQKCNPYIVNEDHVLCLKMPDHKVIFWNQTEISWSILWLNKEDKKIQKKSIKAGIKEKIICRECDIELNSNLAHHYERMHKNISVPTSPRKKPTINPPDTQEVKNALLKMKKFADTISDDNTLDISIKDYLKLNPTTKYRLSGYVGECVQWSYKKIELDPYVLGVWLGDGYKNGYNFAINSKDDSEILEYLENWGKDNDAKLSQELNNPIAYRITSLSKCGIAPLKKLLSKYNLINNKHIPKEYLINSREVRLGVLAGLIDSDGYTMREGTRINITQGMNHEKLAKDIIFLVKSLGLMCCYNIKDTQWKHKEFLKRGKAYNINISGENAKDIPTLVKRKKCMSPKKINTTNTGTLKIKKVKSDDFIGLKIDGNQRFVLNDFTVTHNCNIFSSNFILEVVDLKRKKKYYQKFSNNMYDREEPKIKRITNKETKSYIKFTFTPDYKRFGVKGLSDDMVALFKKRVYDISACTPKNVKVYLNGDLIKARTFQDYISMFYKDHDPEDIVVHSQSIYEESNKRWKVGIVFDPNPGFRHISYVNGIYTFQGGTHIRHVLDQIIYKLIDHIKEKNKKEKDLNIRYTTVKDNMTLFLDSVIEDPSFSSQTKEFLQSKVSNFGSRCEISDEFIQALAKTGISSEVIGLSKFKQDREFKKSDGKKTANLKGLQKLVDAHWAGSRRSSQCRLILTEGDSAKGFAIAGLDVIGRDKYGVFPLRGKLLNVREATKKQLLNNEEIINIKKIMGLKHDKVYNDTKELRYGGIIILTDEDRDGYHIKGLVMNFIHYFWPSLMCVENFIQSITTPIVKAFKNTDRKRNNPKIFYTMTEYENWAKKINPRLWTIKYYKGLGTHKIPNEARESFNDFNNTIKTYVWTQEDEYLDNNSKDSEDFKEDKTNNCYRAMTLAFDKKRSDDRKVWLRNYDRNCIMENNIKKIPFDDFINKELIHFSNYDTERSIPRLTDGFKPSLRKILYTAFKKNILNKEIKVAQFAGSVSEEGYHHGETSLHGAIIGMAQNFIGSNNINLLNPNGNFGSRRQGGKDAASPRYIYTQLNYLTPLIFRKEDDPVLERVVDDGIVVEPVTYAPIIPMILVNGCEGIGTGFSSKIPCFNPKDIIANIRRLIKGQVFKDMYPWYRGFKGTIKRVSSDTYQSHGLIDPSRKSATITEIPVGIWTENYLQFIDKSIPDDIKQPGKNQFLVSKKSSCGNNTINLDIHFIGNNLQEFIMKNELHKKLKLNKNIKITNMNLYNTRGVIQKYYDIETIFKEYYNFRLDMYDKRKKYYIKLLENDMNILKWKVKFIKYVVSKPPKIVVFRRKKTEIINKLVEYKFPKLSKKVSAGNDKKNKLEKNYNYITNIPLFALTLEEIDKLNEDYKNKKEILEEYINTSLEELYEKDLKEFEKAYNKWFKEMELEDQESDKKTNKKGKKVTVRVRK